MAVSQADHERLVENLVNNHPVVVPSVTTGHEIKEIAGQPADFNLFRVQGDHEIAVGDDEEVRVHKGERFIACPGLEPA